MLKKAAIAGVGQSATGALRKSSPTMGKLPQECGTILTPVDFEPQVPADADTMPEPRLWPEKKVVPRRLSSILRLGRRCWRAIQKRHYPSETRPVDWSVGYVEVHALEGVARHLRPDAILLHRHFVDLNIVHFELSALLVHPEIDVVILVLAARLPEVGTHKVFAFLLQVSH